MYLQEIEIIGFKSFANKTVLIFPKPNPNNRGITAIVGPNGSGKSNIADAIRWVLGESSAKQLRGKSRDDVIFSGSAKKHRMNYAEVTLRINNEDKAGGIELTEIEISRRVFRDGETEFLLNKNKVRREDILMMLAQASFGQRTYAVIGQGMADSVLSASLQERKAFFEEAAGVTQYQIKRQQTLNKFEATRENLAQTELTIKELEPRLKSLSRQVTKLEKREKIERELKDLQVQYYHHLHTNLQTLITTISKEKANLESAIGQLQKKIDAVQKRMNAVYSGDSRQSLFEQLQKEYNQLIQEKNILLRDETLIKAQKDAEYQKGGQSNLVWLNNKRDKIHAQLKELKDVLKNTQLKAQSESQRVKEQNDELERIEKRILTVKNELATIKASNVGSFDEEDDLREIHEMHNQLLDTLMNLKDLTHIEDVRNQARAISAKLAVYIESLHAHKKLQAYDLDNLQSQLEQLIEQKNRFTTTLAQFQLTEHTAQEKERLITDQITNTQEELLKIENEITLARSQSNETTLLAEIERQLSEVQVKITLLDREIAAVEAKIEKFNETEEEKKSQLMNLQKENQALQLELNRLSQQLNNVNIEIAKHSIRIEDLEKEILEEGLSLKEIVELNDSATLAAHNITEEEVHQAIHQLKKQLQIIGGIDQETVDEYTEIKERYEFLTTQVKDLENAIISMEKIIEELDQTITKQFDEAFREINREFQKYFKILFNGGHAELKKVTLEDEKRVIEQTEKEKMITGATATIERITKKIKEREKETYNGIEIIAEPPGKKINSINMLSGGERALTSIALISAIIANNNPPFVLLDEMDAALDESNAQRFAAILKDLSSSTQCIVITHTRATMNEAQLLYGVTMRDDGVSQLLSIELKDAESMDVVRH